MYKELPNESIYTLLQSSDTKPLFFTIIDGKIQEALTDIESKLIDMAGKTDITSARILYQSKKDKKIILGIKDKIEKLKNQEKLESA